MECVVVGCGAEVEVVETGRVFMESGCGSAGSSSAGLLLRRDVFCSEAVVVVAVAVAAWSSTSELPLEDGGRVAWSGGSGVVSTVVG